MTQRTLIARVEEEQGGTLLVRSPAVGVLSRVPERGVFVNPLQSFLTITALGRPHGLQLPHQVKGFVAERLVEGTWVPVDYNRPLLRLSLAQEQAAAVGAGPEAAADPALAGLVPVRSPSQGVFYRRPSPDSPAYVDEGSAVGTGTVLGLVEVMKCFNQIAYGGPGLPERGTVAKIFVQDAAEVETGQVLFLVRPA